MSTPMRLIAKFLILISIFSYLLKSACGIALLVLLKTYWRRIIGNNRNVDFAAASLCTTSSAP